MNKYWSTTLATLLSITLLSLPTFAEKPDAHAPSEGESHEEEGGIRLTPRQLETAGIKVEALQARKLANEVTAPGEIRLNAYATSKVATRIPAQILSREARLGDHVKKGQPLIVLSSVEMASAQGELLVAEREWRRVRKLGREVVSEQRYTKARIAREQARARVLAYGMTQGELNKLIADGNAGKADGRFQLLAGQDGTIIHDDFIIGELVEPGRVLFEISDESSLWVEARLTPDQVTGIRIGAPATIEFQDQKIEGKVIQIHHSLDENTRTLGVRIEIPNPEDHLHPGLFVATRIEGGSSETALAVPADAVMRSPDGDWQVFIEHEPGEFEPREVEVVRSVRGQTVIDGLAPGTKVVTQGAFFLQSELAKSGFEVHNH
ncbi:MAG TPA: efflux RND transporter periplasmic adaptor subunit [Gammaproteobacteria bacterium]|nr:efflux RND transporter periplasmic adaptor subunit [Gammaproteobacteria bacterium]